MSSLIGRTLGQYEVIELLGRGGMATVYLGRQASVDRLVAIKVLPPHPGLDEQFKQRFELEAKTIGGLQNPNILPLYDYGTDDDVIYLVMAYVESGTLEDLIDNGPMAVREVERLIRSIAGGLDFAHRKGVIHRDVKPANILISDGHPLLADFGMVKMIAGSSNLTGEAIVGTPSYMAPEQGKGLAVDERVDIYALGVILYEMLTGKLPYTSDSPMQTVLMHINEPIPDLLLARPDLSPEFADVIEKAMAKDPDDRFQSAIELAEAFSKAIHGDSDSLAQVQKELPLESTPRDNLPPDTVKLEQEVPRHPTPEPTIIVRESTNPIVLLAGFGLIAIVVVVVAFLLINNQNNNTTITSPTTSVDPTSEPTEVSVAPTDLPTLEPIQTNGEVRFSTDVGLGDTVRVSVSELAPLGDDAQYAAWLLNTETDTTMALGRIIVDGFGEGGITVTDSEGRMLPGEYNALIITEETEIGDEPSDTVRYRARVLPEVSSGLHEIFTDSPDGLSESDGSLTSLLDGALIEADIAARHAGLAANASDLGGASNHGEHTINILHGENVDHDGNGRSSNPGRGVGVYFFLDAIDAALETATTHPEATTNLQINADHIRVCTQNVREWADEVVALELAIIASESIEAAHDDLVAATEKVARIIEGMDVNVNGIVEPFEGECGLNQIPEFGLQFAQMDIFPEASEE